MIRLIPGLHEFPSLQKGYAQEMAAAKRAGCGDCREDEIAAKYSRMLAAKKEQRRRVAGVKIKYPGIHK